MVASPFYFVPKSAEKRLTIVLLIAMVILFSAMRYFDTPLKNEVSTAGIVSFELAKDLQQTKEILNSWDTYSKTSAGMSIGLDFLFLIVYAVFISLLIHRLNEYLWENSKLYKIGIVMIWAVFIAAVFDIIENIALIQLLLGDFQQKWSSTAYYFAVFKFGLLAMSIFFIVINLILLPFRNLRKKVH